jgi:hypothetical protein
MKEITISLWRNSPTRARVASFLRFLENAELLITFDRISLDGGSTYLTIHNNCKTHTHTHTPMPPAEFKPAIPASEQSLTYALDLLATGMS